MATRLTTKIDGKEYKVILTEMEGRPIIWVRVVRQLADGTTVDAFLSHRQHKAEARVRSRFAKEINDHIAKVKAAH